jgi:Cof subfamily protein (haloacid dehalogenase superfamily)
MRRFFLYPCLMNFPNLAHIKLVVTDMDGTLLNSHHLVSERFYTAFEELKSLGVTFVAASGRQYDSIYHKLYRIADQIYIAAENGGYTLYQDREIHQADFPSHLLERPLNLLEKRPDIHAVLCTKNKAFIKRGFPDFESFVIQYYSAYETIERLSDCTEPVLKIALYHPEGSEKHIYPHVEALSNELKVKISGPNWVDLSHQEAHKGTAVAKIQSLLNISPAETLCLGDYLNDLEMLGQSHYSFSMGNAHPDVVKAAKYQTASNDQFGVEMVLEKIILDIRSSL